MRLAYLFIICILPLSCNKKQDSAIISENRSAIPQKQNNYQKLDDLFEQNPTYISQDFDYPVGKPNAKGYYNAQKFQENNHLGDDWNGTGGGNSDLGDPIYTVSNGYVSFAEDIAGGWGNIIRIVHQYNGKYYESLYAHCQSIQIKKGDFIKKGTRIGTIGNANGMYLAHLHLEIRNDIFMDIGPGYSENTTGYLNPTKFIKEH